MLDQFAAQLFLSRPLLTLNQLQLALNTVQEGESEPVRWTEENVNDLIAGLKVSLEPLGFDLIRAFDHQTGVPIYTLLNLVQDKISQMATEYTAVEIAFLRLIIETIVTANNHEFSVSSTAVLRREMGVADDSTLKQFTKVQAEQLIDRFVHDGWLLHSRQGKLSLAMRTVLELEIYLKATFGDELLDCHRCRKLVITQGYFCPSDGCGVALHKHCAQVIFRIQGQQQCPGCRHDIKYGSN